MNRLTLILVIGALAWNTLVAQRTKQSAPGGPGVDAHWPGAAKDGFGTSTTLQSKVWFTLTNGTMTEVFYPTIDTPNTQSLRFIFCNARVCKDEERDMTHSLRVLDNRALTFQQTNTADGFRITKTYTTDPERSTVLLEVNTELDNDATSLYVYYDPSLKNSGMHDTGWIDEGSLLAADGNIASALIASSGFEEAGTAFATNDIQSLPSQHFDRAADGNVVQIGKLRDPRKFTLALAFGATPGQALATARGSLRKGFATCRREYEAGWRAYLSSLHRVKTSHPDQMNMAAMVLKASEDKTYRGAFIASPSTPWGGGPNANEPGVSGYHAVWSRDLYQVATALLALGDRAAANRALNYLFKVQQRPDGSFPQNSWVDGRPIGSGMQMDEVGLPIVLAHQLGRTDSEMWLKHIKPAADFILSKGPVTNQDRWEEKSGYSPATIAAEIAGLVCASSIAINNGDTAKSALYLKTADAWAAGINGWTATSNGPEEPGQYFLRLTERGDPNDADDMEINSGGGRYDQRSIVDAGFLELVRLGIKRADDPLIVRSIKVVGAKLKVSTPVGPAWYRYNHDAYGERLDGKSYDGKTGVGRLWTLLTGERGQYEVALGQSGKAREMLGAMARFGNAGMMIPEQVWDRGETVGTGTGSATPLAWSMAQFIRLAINIERGRNIETPRIVTARYTKTLRHKK